MRRRHLVYVVIVCLVGWHLLAYMTMPRKVAEKEPNHDDLVSRELKAVEDELRHHGLIVPKKDQVTSKLPSVTARYTATKVTQPVKHVETNPPVQQISIDPYNAVIPVLVFACNRITVKQNLDQLLKYRPSAEKYPIIVSQDCGHKPTSDAIDSYGAQITHLKHPDLTDISLPWTQRKFQGYYKISRHYRWALNQIFRVLNYSVVIIVEDDLDISPDFFEYFTALFPILERDPTLWCVSAWNDNGKVNNIEDNPLLLYRTDFFPGLGWMLDKNTWLELEPKWPATFWDDWMRHPNQRKNRTCIHPEVSRTRTFGRIGVSRGQFYDKHLKFIKLNDKPVPWTTMDLTYLLKENYDVKFVRDVYECPIVSVAQLQAGVSGSHPVRVQYTSKTDFKSIAKALGIMDDLKSGVPRGGYRGVVSFMFAGRRVHLTPPMPWTGYDPTWN
ncbi:alpha-1,3-mannosyl-glycoprotein 2-beta-N-acetylglucosaminyltransferase isoform X2 [Lingula anatina]|uniref:Alpha-1,3-mannosyl-glycoprotein 2-beta-N-acetylglucosaminyltransferase n=1 Tax=Lingula anatina TaxID=7574 RepID=A0A1S3JXP4_LINAN|nr:alpha-1,3-mannosyl-glycoprotein 2-beta-N-acetylglucosaminyltransferase isoform X2 [Lingula anatina]|eukprot:XP_013415077.1 alpha-1,3-mannosyl-glycoprotein 2-beta-N-acetylglucosaminyltransferase isoform X2 [Lingula anatina]